MAVKSPAGRRSRGGGRDRYGRPTLTDKSTNNPILSKSTTTIQVAFDSAAGITLPQLPKVDTPPYPKINPKRKPALDPKDTPLLIVEVAYPTKPHPAVSSLGHKDFATTLLSSNVRKPGCKRYFRSHSEPSETGSDNLYYRPPGVLGVSAPRMNDSIGITSRTWARDILGGTNQETEKTVGVSLLVTGYGHQESKNELPELKNTLDLVVQRHQGQRMQKGRVIDYPDFSPVNTSELISSTRNVMSPRDFLEDPFFIPERYKFNRGIRVGKDTGGSVRLHCAMDPTQDRCNLKERIGNRTEVGLPKIRQKHFESVAITRQLNTKFSLAPATTDLNQGTAFEFNDSESDNEMPSSSPIAKSTPKKDWYRFEDYDSVDTHNWGKNRQAQGEKPGPLKPMIFAWGSSDIHRLEGVTMRELPGGRPGSVSKIQQGCQEQTETVDTFGGIKHPHRHSSSRSEIPEENKRGEGKSTIVTVNIIDLKKKKINSRKRNKDLIYMDESRMGKRLSREKKHKLTGSAVNFRNSGSKSVDSAGGDVREKEIHTRNSSLRYERTGMGDDIDELQMDLPGMRI